MTPASLQERVARLEDVRSIETLKYRYAQICDTGYSAEGFRSIFTDGASWSADGFGSFSGIDAICGFFQTLAKTVLQATHYVTSPQISVADDGLSASGTFYLLCLSRSVSRRDPTEVDFVLTLGTYRDRFRKENGRWLFEDLNVSVHHAARLAGADGTPAAMPGRAMPTRLRATRRRKRRRRLGADHAPDSTAG